MSHSLRNKCYLRELLLLQILRHRRVKVHGIPFVQAVNLSSLLDLHVPINQDEFTDRLMSGEKEGTLTLQSTLVGT